MKLNLKIRPSNLGQYFELNCDKYLIYNSVSAEDCIKLGWNVPEPNKLTPAMRAGQKWETKLLNSLKASDRTRVIHAKKSANKKDEPHIDGRKNDIADILKRLNSKEEIVYIYQARLKVTQSFARKYLDNKEEKETTISLSDSMRPDFIKVDYSPSREKYCLTIIDAKNSTNLKINAIIQIALYAKLLDSIINDENITNCYVDDIGIVWNREKATDKCIEHDFELKEADDKINDFFYKKATEICNIINSCESGDELQDKLDYCMTQKCEYCGNYESCKELCEKKRNVKLLPYITQQAQVRIKELIDEGKMKDDSFDSLKQYLDNRPQDLTEDCHFWNNIKNNLEAYEKGITDYYDGKIQRYGKNTSSISMPVSQDFALIMTAQQDVNSGRIYAYSWLLKPGKGIDIWNQGFNELGYVHISEGNGKGTYYDTLIALKDTKEEFDRIDRLFVEKIYCLLEKISDYPDKKKRKLQCYVMDEYERNNIEDALYYMLENTDSENDQMLIEKVMALLFLLQGDRVATDLDQQPEECVENPVTVLTSEISQLYVLSAGMSYNLKTIASIFSPKYNFNADKGLFFGKLRNIVQDEPIFLAWNLPDKDKCEKMLTLLGYHLRKRLFVEYIILTAVQHDNGNQISIATWPKQYQIQKPKYADYPEISKLDFENKYEQLLIYRDIRRIRVSGIENAIDNGQILWLEYTGKGNTYLILNREKYIGKEWFGAWLCEDTPENRLQIMLLKDIDYTTRSKFAASYSVKGTGTVFYPVDFGNKYNFIDNGTEATVDFKAKKNANFTPKVGSKYLLFEVYSDLNSEKTAEGLGELVTRQELLNPQLISGETGITYSDIEHICEKYWSIDGNCFSPSQKDAFTHFIENKLTVLIGPPASGKTDFIARALITIASFYKIEKNIYLKIMVSANSHSAIENVLIKLDRMLNKSNPCGINIYKAGKIDDQRAFEDRSVRILDDKTEADTMSKTEIQIIGMTCWSAYKAFHNPKTGKMRSFDIIVIDEASQMRSMDAFMDLECSDNNTRFLLVGDEAQLPPIVLGKYREKEGEKSLYGSIFHMFITGLGEGHPDIVKLTDNFRMNEMLCRYPAKKIYGETYRAFNKEIGNQKIRLVNKPVGKIIEFMLDPDYPLVFCELSGNSRKQNKAEVKLVTDLVHSLWQCIGNERNERLASSDGNFWREFDGRDGACGIISPHHEHINRVRSSIAEDLGLRSEAIFIGTVDKLQGKERSVVIVSYGVSDIEKISTEAEFIYSSNRFNVSMTRGKAKTIVILSDAIAESSLETDSLAANDQNLRKGVEYIHGYVNYIREENEEETVTYKQYDNYYDDVVLKVWKKRMRKKLEEKEDAHNKGQSFDTEELITSEISVRAVTMYKDNKSNKKYKSERYNNKKERTDISRMNYSEEDYIRYIEELYYAGSVNYDNSNDYNW